MNASPGIANGNANGNAMLMVMIMVMEMVMVIIYLMSNVGSVCTLLRARGSRQKRLTNKYDLRTYYKNGVSKCF